MSSNRLRLLLVSVMAVFAVSAVASASASAATCHKVAVPKTGAFEKMSATTGKCEGPVAEGEFVETKSVKDLNNGKGELCAEVAAGTGDYETLATCEAGTPKAKGNFIRVFENEEEQQLFCRNAGGKCEEALKKGLTSKSGVGTFEAGTNKIICQTDEDPAKLAGLESVEKVVVTFKKCKGEETKSKATCTVNSVFGGVKKPAETIETTELRGEIGEVAESEATSKVGLLLEPVKEPFVTLQGSCLSPAESAVEGALIGEVTPVNVLQETSEVKFLAPTSGTQKIKTIERSLAKHCAGAPATRECKEDAVVKATLKAFGSTSVSEETIDTNKFEEELEVRPGL